MGIQVWKIVRWMEPRTWRKHTFFLEADDIGVVQAEQCSEKFSLRKQMNFSVAKFRWCEGARVGD
jgi:hypothetical protein